VVGVRDVVRDRIKDVVRDRTKDVVRDRMVVAIIRVADREAENEWDLLTNKYYNGR
jgi:hypothetical protein